MLGAYLSYLDAHNNLDAFYLLFQPPSVTKEECQKHKVKGPWASRQDSHLLLVRRHWMIREQHCRESLCREIR